MRALGAIFVIGLIAYFWGSSAPYFDWKIPPAGSVGPDFCVPYAHGDYSMTASLSVFAAALIGGLGGTVATVWFALKASLRAAAVCGLATIVWVAALLIGLATHVPACVAI